MLVDRPIPLAVGTVAAGVAKAHADVVLITHHHRDHCENASLGMVCGPDTAVFAPRLCAEELPGREVTIVDAGTRKPLELEVVGGDGEDGSGSDEDGSGGDEPTHRSGFRRRGFIMGWCARQRSLVFGFGVLTGGCCSLCKGQPLRFSNPARP